MIIVIVISPLAERGEAGVSDSGERRGGAKESTNSYIAKFTQYLPNTRKNGRVMGIYPYLTTHQNSVRRSTQYPVTQEKTEWVHSPGCRYLPYSSTLIIWHGRYPRERMTIIFQMVLPNTIFQMDLLAHLVFRLCCQSSNLHGLAACSRISFDLLISLSSFLCR